MTHPGCVTLHAGSPGSPLLFKGDQFLFHLGKFDHQIAACQLGHAPSHSSSHPIAVNIILAFETWAGEHLGF